MQDAARAQMHANLQRDLSGRAAGELPPDERFDSPFVNQAGASASPSRNPNLNVNVNPSEQGYPPRNGRGGSDGAKNAKPKKKHPIRRKILLTLLLLFLVALAVAGYIAHYLYTNYQELKAGVQYVDVLSSAPDDGWGADVTLIVGNDGRSLDAQTDVLGARSDTIMLLIHSALGKDTLTSIPRDTYVRIPEFIDEQAVFGTVNDKIELTYNKINASYSYGGPRLLVRTVELLTALKVDHYVEIGFDGVQQLVDAVGGINLCYDTPINDTEYTGLIWTPGCLDVDGHTALAFARMRYDDPTGDIGRAQRQHQVIDKSAQRIIDLVKAGDIWNLYNVSKLLPIAKTMLGFVKFDTSTSLMQIKDMVERFKNAQSAATLENGIIPIDDPLGFDEEVGSIVEIDGDEVRSYLRGLAAE